MTLADWQRQQAINLDGVFLSIKHAIPAMKKAGGGSIVLMSSIAGLRGAPGLAAYSATKGGVRLLAKSVALEHAADNIRCNSVHPGIIATPIWGKIPTGAEGNRRNAPIDPRERAAAVVPLTRVGEAQDIANGVLFLCTEAANYMTGQELVIDGGMTAGGRPPARPSRRPQRVRRRGRLSACAIVRGQFASHVLVALDASRPQSGESLVWRWQPSRECLYSWLILAVVADKRR